jgi:integrase
MHVSDLWYREQTRTFYVTIDGKQHSLKTDDKVTAYLKLADFLRDPVPEGEPLTVHTLRSRFLASMEGIRSPATITWYKFALSDRDGYKVPNWRISSINDDLVQQFLRTVPGNGNTKNGVLRALIRMFNWAVDQKLIDKNPVDGIQRRLDGVLPGYQPRVVRLSAEQVKVILAAARADIHDLLFVLSETGARPFEITGAEAKHLQDGVLVLPVERAKSKKKERRIVLHDKARELVESLAAKHPTGKLFRRQNGKAWDRTAVAHACQDLSRKLKIIFSAYAFRHTYATLRVESKANLALIAAAMGHSSTDMVAKVYSHPDVEAIRDLNRNGAA